METSGLRQQVRLAIRWPPLQRAGDAPLRVMCAQPERFLAPEPSIWRLAAPAVEEVRGVIMCRPRLSIPDGSADAGAPVLAAVARSAPAPCIGQPDLPATRATPCSVR